MNNKKYTGNNFTSIFNPRPSMNRLALPPIASIQKP